MNPDEETYICVSQIFNFTKVHYVSDGLGEAASPYTYTIAGVGTAATIEDKWFGGARPDYLNVSMAAIANTVGRQSGENAQSWPGSNS